MARSNVHWQSITNVVQFTLDGTEERVAETVIGVVVPCWIPALSLAPPLGAAGQQTCDLLFLDQETHSSPQHTNEVHCAPRVVLRSPHILQVPPTELWSDPRKACQPTGHSLHCNDQVLSLGKRKREHCHRRNKLGTDVSLELAQKHTDPSRVCSKEVRESLKISNYCSINSYFLPSPKF